MAGSALSAAKAPVVISTAALESTYQWETSIDRAPA